jgi:hypothetical protein
MTVSLDERKLDTGPKVSCNMSIEESKSRTIPASISYSTTPTAQKSTANPYQPPSITSGAIYDGLPQIPFVLYGACERLVEVPVGLYGENAPGLACGKTLANPKSAMTR